jgi:hypothetical protein
LTPTFPSDDDTERGKARVALVRVIREAANFGLRPAVDQADAILASDWLREHDAKVWHEGLHAAYNHVSRLEDADAAGQGVMIPDPINPYRPTGAPNG